LNAKYLGAILPIFLGSVYRELGINLAWTMRIIAPRLLIYKNSVENDAAIETNPIKMALAILIRLEASI